MVYKTNTVQLVKKGKEWSLTVNWEGDKRKFWINFPWSLLSVKQQEKIDDIKKEFLIRADTVQTLEDYLKKRQKRFNYDDCIKFLYNVGNQLQTLERFNMGFPFLNIKDIIVVDKKHYFYLNDEDVYEFTGEKMLEIDKIYKKQPFISPEFEKITTIPSEVHYKSGFYSLASIIIFCMFNKNVTGENKIEILDPINTTKLYWALLRLLEDIPSDRYYLII